MNLFVTSPCAIESARYLDNKRVVKMILEVAQMLSTAVRLREVDAGYKPTHINHPANVWVRTSRQNFEWTVRHGLALSAEYTERYDKVHKSKAVVEDLARYAHLFPDLGQTPFVNCAANSALGISYKTEPNVYIAYQKYLNDRWDTDKIEPRWT